MHQDEASRLRHSIRGTINALKLGASVLDTGLNRAETLEFLEYFDQSADKMCELLDQYETLPPTPSVPPPAEPAVENPR